MREMEMAVMLKWYKVVVSENEATREQRVGAVSSEHSVGAKCVEIQ